MKAKVLADGVLLADDGARFTYTHDEVKSEGALKVGDEVDFVVDGNSAKEIYRLKSGVSINLSQASDALKGLNIDFKSDINYVRNFGLFGSIAAFFVAVPYVGFLAGLASFAMIFMAISRLSSVSGNQKPRKDYIHMTVAFIVAVLCINMAIPDQNDILQSAFNRNEMESLAIKTAIFALVAVIAVLYGIFRQYKAFYGISNITGEKLFLLYVVFQILSIAAACYELVKFITMLTGKNLRIQFEAPNTTLSYILLAISCLALIVAWLRIKEIKKA